MRRDTQGTLIAVVGVVVGQLVLGGRFAQYVKPTMRVPLLAAAGVLVVLGGVTAWHAFPLSRGRRSATDDDAYAPLSDAAGHHHGHAGSPVGLLLMVPVVAIGLIAPPSLGADAVGRSRSYAPDRPKQAAPAEDTSGDEHVWPLPPAVLGAHPLPISEYIARAVWDEDSLAGATVRLTGFVMPEDTGDGDTFLLTRFVVGCCAADALPVQVRVSRAVPIPAADVWVEVDGEFAGWPPGATPQDDLEPLPDVTATRVTVVAEPDEPYEF